MGVDIGGAFTIAGTSGSQALKIAGASDALIIDTSGRTTYPNQIGFIAGIGTDPGWIALAAGWNLQNWMSLAVYNKGGGYSTSTGRFTAPIAGSYLFHWSGYHYKPSAVPGHYIHPMCYINGAIIQTAYRLFAYLTPTGYSFNGEIVDIYYLNAGDYVDVQIYAAAAGISIYRSHSHFSGFLVG